MSRDVVIVYWIESASCELRSETMGPSDIPGARTYESEVLFKLGHDPIDITVIPLAQAGSESARAMVAALKAKAAMMRATASDA